MRKLSDERWPSTPTDEADRAWAHEVQAEIDRAEKAGRARKHWAEQNNWTGHLGEKALVAWLREFGLDPAWPPARPTEPDVVIGGVGVAVKTRNHYAEGPFRAHYSLPLPTYHYDEGVPERFWAVFDHQRLTVALVGGVTSARFRDEAQLLRKGEIMESGREVSHDFYRVRADQLEAPRAWLARLVPETAPVASPEPRPAPRPAQEQGRLL